MVYTNLGRAPLSSFALMAMLDAGGYSDLEYNIKEGSRGSRQDHIKEIAKAVFGVEDAIAVNNNAAAVMLVLASLAAGREVIVSRGELVEIGGSFRMPDVMTLSGAILKEVGTTNKTRLSDYEAAINENTGLIMKVHRSNFALIGFTDEAEIKELSALANSRGLPLYVDMGSGIPFDLSSIRDSRRVDGAFVPGGRSGYSILQRRQGPERPAGRNHCRPQISHIKNVKASVAQGCKDRQVQPGGACRNAQTVRDGDV